MDFFGDLFDLGDRKHRRGYRGEHDDEHRGDHDSHDEHGYEYNDRRPDYENNENRKNGIALKCVKCAGLLTEVFNFCPGCGTAVPRAKRCISCGSENVPQAKFCASCGTKLE